MNERGRPSGQHAILFAAAEVAPLVHAGGLGDVVGALPKALAALGNDVRVVMPRYRETKAIPDTTEPVMVYPVLFGSSTYTVAVWRTTLPGSQVPVYLLENDVHFGSGKLYFQDVADTAEQLRRQSERFLFFAHAVTALPAALAWWPHLIHCHDWHTGAVPFLVHAARDRELRFRSVATLYTIHNLALQGWVSAERFAEISGLMVENDSILRRLVARDQGVNLGGLGILSADAVSTVSPTYAEEILTPAFGVGLDPYLRERRSVLHGVLNGIDESRFDPSRDAELPQPYSAATIEQKTLNTAWLRHHTGLRNAGPIFGVVSRLTEQKGILLICDIIPRLVELGAGVVVLGTGEPSRERALIRYAERYPEAVSVTLGFDIGYAQRIYAGSDAFLMPSKFEPCGLGQMIALRYGTIPIVRATGGLRDTVTEGSQGVGFVFHHFTASDFLAACERALHVFARPHAWQALQRRAMMVDHSWKASAQAYESLYAMTRHIHATEK